MLKLYKFTDGAKSYWETWDHDGVHTVSLGHTRHSGQFEGGAKAAEPRRYPEAAVPHR